MMYTGIDVSEHQGKIDWEKVKKSGVDFAIIRTGYGQTHPDKYGERNMSECDRLGIPYGCYHFSYATSAADAKKEAEYCLSLMKGHNPAFPVYFDFEYDSRKYAMAHGVNVTPAFVREVSTTFCQTMEHAKFFAGVYANYDYVNNFYGNKFFERFSIWYAWYAEKANRGAVPMWQYTSGGTIPGISGRVDCDKCFVDFPKIIKDNGMNNTGKCCGCKDCTCKCHGVRS